MGWLIGAGIVLIGILSGAAQIKFGNTGLGIWIIVFWIFVAAILLFAFASTYKRRKAKKQVRNLFEASEVVSTVQQFGELCSCVIELTPQRYRRSIEIHLYVGKQAGLDFEVSAAISNFEHQNIGSMCPAVMYAQRLGWDVSAGLIRLRENARLPMNSDFYYSWCSEGNAAVYKRLNREFLKNCPCANEKQTAIDEDGLFISYKVQ